MLQNDTAWAKESQHISQGYFYSAAKKGKIAAEARPKSAANVSA